jgi:hypothetical protein
MNMVLKGGVASGAVFIVTAFPKYFDVPIEIEGDLIIHRYEHYGECDGVDRIYRPMGETCLTSIKIQA